MRTKNLYFPELEPLILDAGTLSSIFGKATKLSGLTRLRINHHQDTIICTKEYLSPINDPALPMIILSSIHYSLGRYTYMPDVTSNFTIRHLDCLNSTVRQKAAEIINNHLKKCGKNEPQPELWYKLLSTLSADSNGGGQSQMRKMQPVDSMERISRQHFVENMDDILDRISAEDIGIVITEDGKDDLVICPYSWYSPFDEDDFGCIVNSAIRNAMHSGCEELETVIQFVVRHCHELDAKTLDVAIKDISSELERPLAPLNHPEVWQEFLITLQRSLHEKESKSNRGTTSV